MHAVSLQIRTVGYNSLPTTDNCMQAKLHAADRLVAVFVLRRTGEFEHRLDLKDAAQSGVKLLESEQVLG